MSFAGFEQYVYLLRNISKKQSCLLINLYENDRSRRQLQSLSGQVFTRIHGHKTQYNHVYKNVSYDVNDVFNPDW
jgi:hypothetical protein